MQSFGLIKDLTRGITFFAISILFFDLNYYFMAKLPGHVDNMCVVGAGLNAWNIAFSIVMSLMVGILVIGVWELHKRMVQGNVKLASLSGIGALFGSLTVFCTLCTLPVISLFGLSVSLSFFTLYEWWFKGIALVLMGLSLYLVERQLRGSCGVCKK